MKNFHPNNATDAYWCRDQNFRKYFQARKRHGIEPSVDYNKFYNKDKEQSFYRGIDELVELANSVNKIK